jgi:Helix-turn-helix domain
MTIRKRNASGKGGAHVDQAGGLEATNQNTKSESKSTTDNDILANKSTSTEVQLQKTLALLAQSPKTTIELRDHGVMMPAARVFQLKNEHQFVITTELVTLYDANGFRHGRCARYHLMQKAASEASA